MLKWEILPQPTYSPDIATSDYHLFWRIAQGLAKKHFHSYEEAKKRVDSWLASKVGKKWWLAMDNTFSDMFLIDFHEKSVRTDSKFK